MISRNAIENLWNYNGSKLLSKSIPYYLTKLIKKRPAVCPVLPPIIGMKLGAVSRRDIEEDITIFPFFIV
ncbi:MAG TPA: hypothetical protein VFF47_01905 [Nitrospirota bacterium]|nr:hypothetical protein [Nitrospirota bacterium]